MEGRIKILHGCIARETSTDCFYASGSDLPVFSKVQVTAEVYV